MTINSPRFIKDVEIERRHVRNRDAQLKDDRGAIKVGKGRGGLSVLHAFHIIKAAQINTLRANRAAISTQGYAVVQRHFGLLIASRLEHRCTLVTKKLSSSSRILYNIEYLIYQIELFER